jgi:hypothetical protein
MWLLSLSNNLPSCRPTIQQRAINLLLGLDGIIATVIKPSSANPLKSPWTDHSANSNGYKIFLALTAYVFGGWINCWIRVMRVDMELACHRIPPYDCAHTDFYAGVALELLSCHSLSCQEVTVQE